LGLPIYFIKELTIEIATTTNKNKRVFKSFSVSPQVDFTYTQSKAFQNLDFIAGVSGQTDLLTKYSLESDDSPQASVWSEDEFSRERRLQFSYFIGLQTNY
jgi:hypothetical protein